MSTLSNYRASIARLLDAENVEDAFEVEGFGEVARSIADSKSFRASRSLQSHNALQPKKEAT